MRLIVFKQLAMAMVEIEKLLRDKSLSDESRVLLLKQRDALNEINDYLWSFEWLSHESSKQKVRLFLESGYNYKDVWQKAGSTSRTSFETSIWHAARVFQKKIGESTLQLILDGKVDEGLRQFRISIGKMDLTQFIPKSLCDMLPVKEYTRMYSLSECLAELRFLKNLTYSNIKSRLSLLDEVKLSFLRYVLESPDPRYAKRRELMYRYLEGKINDLEELALALKHLEITGEKDDVV